MCDMQGDEDEAEGSIKRLCDQCRIPKATPQIVHYDTPPCQIW